ncbi:glycosyl transferase family 90 [Polynucleobacter difficilis]|uniref:glycosyl transferase family 90 n=1 Tax=Polynucleobacter difficilis TaxID=556054 RepID=UPI000D3B8AE9|nr:glycosyl transferase family 90 [Polynucleobacter difficilis]
MQSFFEKIYRKALLKLFESNDVKKLAQFTADDKWEEASHLLTQNAIPVKIQIEADTQIPRHIGVHWDAYKPDLCVFKLNPNLSKERKHFIAVRLMMLLTLIVSFHKSSYFIAGSMFLNLDDAAETDGLAFCSNRGGQILIPDTDFLETKGYLKTRNQFDANPVAWEQRRPVAFWRGNTTGIRSGDSWRTIPRIQLCEICSDPEVSSLFDVGLSGLAQIPKVEKNSLEASGLMRAYVPIILSNQYKYQIDIDGNSNAWAGLFQKLFSKSAVMKIASPHGFRQWYYDRLIPWEHFVPIESGMGDLVEKTQWLIANDHKAMLIGQKGAELASNLSYDLAISDALQRIHNALLESGSASANRPIQ